MEISIIELEADLMKQAEEQIAEMRQQLAQLNQQLRTARHAINNNVAVIMAMAELSQRNPAQSARLAQLCLEKAPQISTAIGTFSELFDSTLNVAQSNAPKSPAA